MQKDTCTSGSSFLPDSGTELVNNASIASAPSDGRSAYFKRRRDKWALRELLRAITQMKRVCACGRWKIDSDRPREVCVFEGEDQERVAHFSNVQTCGSVWVCPVCAPKIRQERADEIRHGVCTHLGHGGAVYACMYSLPHGWGDRLERTWEVLSEAFRKLKEGRAWYRAKELFGIVGTIRSVDVTVGKNGWHPHLHVLWLLDRAVSTDKRRELERWLYQRWNSYIEQELDRTVKRGLCGLEPVRDARDLSEYMTKAGLVHEGGRYKRIDLEMTRQDLKKAKGCQRNQWELLEDAVIFEDQEDVALWREYERVSKGKNAVPWSRGLKDELGVRERSDEEINEEEVGGETVIEIPEVLWRKLMERGMFVEVLEQAEQGGAVAVAEYLRQL